MHSPNNKKKPRCPNGTRRSKITGNCEKYQKKVIPVNTVKTVKTVKITTKKPRCPNGTRRDKKTGNCLPYNSITKKKASHKKTSHKNKTQKRIVTQIIGMDLQTPYVKQSLSPLTSKNRIGSKSKSFSPELNRQLGLLSDTGSTPPKNIFGCGFETLSQNFLNNKELLAILGTNKMPKILTSKGCVGIRSLTAQRLLLSNLSKVKRLSCNNIVPPKQLLSNCWFNAMFMTFFISDKGRKFFKYFRKLMITGKHSNNKRIAPKKLSDAMFLLNVYIEAAYNVENNDSVGDLARRLNTNMLIYTISNIINNKFQAKILPEVNDASNPITYYQTLIKFLRVQESPSMIYEPNPFVIKSLFDNSMFIENPTGINFEPNKFPDVIVLSFHLSKDKKDQVDVIKKTKEFTIFTTKKSSVSNKYSGAKYKLDSAVVRDTRGSHFISLLTCNGVEKAFEGYSKNRIYDFKWKHLINKDLNWSFQYSDRAFDLRRQRWNFCDGYYMLFYYREK